MERLKFLEPQYIKKFSLNKKNHKLLEIILDKLYKFCYLNIMFEFFTQNYKKIIKKLPIQSSLSLSKYLIFLGLLFYWGVILAGTFLNLN